MAMTINSNLKLQPTDERAMDADGGRTLTIEWKGSYADVSTTAATISAGCSLPTVSGGNAYTPDSGKYTGYKVISWSIRRGNGDTGVLSVSCEMGDTTTTSQDQQQSTIPLKETFSLRSVRNDVSVLAYCSASASGPNRAAVERWMREPDPKLATAFKYTDSDGSVVDMTNESLLSATVPLIRKIMRGTERVIRFYPQLTRRRIYQNPPVDVFQKLSYVDTPPTPSGERTLAPSGLATLIAQYEWLKVQDDCDEQADGKWVRTESWIGILKSDASDGAHPWDPDLYGANRWAMPHDAADPNQSASDDQEE